eukprot:TRINITY_DN11361_c0_g1_i1.p1 TRINITY_DN11361_c0_g1~~TRINITY_DN11361_c0_g1_i1.p1  ORF type:complete len:530 (+),score=145.32 TRINITY_DN11361_c0_g1_i1:80-1669(+)
MGAESSAQRRSSPADEPPQWTGAADPPSPGERAISPEVEWHTPVEEGAWSPADEGPHWSSVEEAPQPVIVTKAQPRKRSLSGNQAAPRAAPPGAQPADWALTLRCEANAKPRRTASKTRNRSYASPQCRPPSRATASPPPAAHHRPPPALRPILWGEPTRRPAQPPLAPAPSPPPYADRGGGTASPAPGGVGGSVPQRRVVRHDRSHSSDDAAALAKAMDTEAQPRQRRRRDSAAPTTPMRAPMRNFSPFRAGLASPAATRGRVPSPAPAASPSASKRFSAQSPRTRASEIQSERERGREGWEPGEWSLLRFWRGLSTGHCVCGCAQLYVDEMLAKRGNYQWLEQKHHFMQWLFPKETNGISGACAPTLTPRAARELARDPVCSDRVRAAQRMILDFYGIELLDESTGAVQRGPHFYDRMLNLATREHNYLRITRVLVSMGMLGRGAVQGPLVELLIEEVGVGGSLEGPLGRGALLRYWVPAVRGRAATGEQWQRRLRQRCREFGVAELSPDEVPESQYFRPGTKAALR